MIITPLAYIICIVAKLNSRTVSHVCVHGRHPSNNCYSAQKRFEDEAACQCSYVWPLVCKVAERCARSWHIPHRLKILFIAMIVDVMLCVHSQNSKTHCYLGPCENAECLQF